MTEEKIENSELLLLERLENTYHTAKSGYYRMVLRKQDDIVRQRLQKIPDNWDDYDQNRDGSQPEIPVEKQHRLSDLKKRKSWELKFESLNIYFISSIENTFLDTLQHKHISIDQIEEAIDSVNSIGLEIGGNIINFKLLLLSLAKRGVSDLYYIMISYDKFNNRDFSSFDEQFRGFCEFLVRHFKGYQNILRNVNIFRETSEFIESFFQHSSSSRGWKINEGAVKEYIENSSQEISIIDLRKIIIAADQYRKLLKKDFEFAQYYYNDKDGKMFRYNFIVESLQQRLEEGKINEQVYDGFNSIRKSFAAIKKFFEERGPGGFGIHTFNYSLLVEFIIKTGKIIEFYFLRSSRYEELKNLRNDILYYTQEEYYHINPDAERL